MPSSGPCSTPDALFFRTTMNPIDTPQTRCRAGTARGDLTPPVGIYQGGVWRKELLEGWLKAQKLEDVNLPTFLKHPTYDDFWKGLSAEAHADKVNAPGLFIGGWYDIFLQGTINSFTTIQQRGGPNARGRCFLVIAPTAHGPFTQKVEYPGGARAPLNYAAPLNLLDHWLKGQRNGVDKLRPVHYYVMGDTDDKKAP